MRRRREKPATATGGFLAFVAGMLAVTLTRPQRILCSVMFDGREPGDFGGGDRAIALELFGDVGKVEAIARTVAVIVAGARSGKTYLAALRLLHLALTVPLHSLARGEVAFGLIVSFDLRTARQALRYVTGAIEAVPNLAGLVVHETIDSVTLRREDGFTVTIEAVPAARCGASLRGRSLIGAILDECAFFRGEGADTSDVDLYRALLPRIVPDGQLIVASTPWGPSGLLFDLWTSNWGKPLSALVAHAPTSTMRDDEHTRVMVAREYARDPNNARREFGAEFIAAESEFIDRATVQACVSIGVTERAPVEGTSYCMAIDASGGIDEFVVAVGHQELNWRENAPPIASTVVDLIRGAKGRLDYEAIADSIAALARRYRVHKVIGDSREAQGLSALLRARGIVLEVASMAPGAQSIRFEALAAKLKTRSIQLLDDPETVKQLSELRVEQLPAGGARYSAPRRKGSHDDRSDVTALLVEAASKLEPAGDVEAVPQLWRDDSGWNGRVLWRRRMPNGDFVPCEPPVGTPQFHEARRARALRGEFTADDLKAIESGEWNPSEELGITVAVIGQ